MGKSTFLQDFKAFAMKGNVIDMAVGVVIGGAFGKIVSSLVANVIMPPIGLLVGGVNFTDLKWVMKRLKSELMVKRLLLPFLWITGSFCKRLLTF